MSDMNESMVLANVMDRTRELTELYLNLLKDSDLHMVFHVNDKPLNSAAWIMAHLPVTQNFLMLRSTGAEHVKIPWARLVGLGSTPPEKDQYPPIDEVRAVMNEVHAKSLAHVRGLSQEQLESPNTSGFNFMGIHTMRDVIVHCIRHEGTHAGHLGWLCKLQGIKTL
jgi:hypothetical protein